MDEGAEREVRRMRGLVQKGEEGEVHPMQGVSDGEAGEVPWCSPYVACLPAVWWFQKLLRACLPGLLSKEREE